MRVLPPCSSGLEMEAPMSVMPPSLPKGGKLGGGEAIGGGGEGGEGESVQLASPLSGLTLATKESPSARPGAR